MTGAQSKKTIPLRDTSEMVVRGARCTNVKRASHSNVIYISEVSQNLPFLINFNASKGKHVGWI